MSRAPVTIRPRTPEDVEECVALLHTVHLADGYPVLWPPDPNGWLSPRGLLEAWVAQDADGIAGHVVLRDDRDGDGSAVELGRLYVRPSARRHGVAVRLIAACREWAAADGLDLVLETVAGTPAVALYEASGWRLESSRAAGWSLRSGQPATLLRYRLA